MPAWGMPLMLPGGFSHYVVASVFLPGMLESFEGLILLDLYSF